MSITDKEINKDEVILSDINILYKIKLFFNNFCIQLINSPQWDEFFMIQCANRNSGNFNPIVYVFKDLEILNDISFEKLCKVIDKSTIKQVYVYNIQNKQASENYILKLETKIVPVEIVEGSPPSRLYLFSKYLGLTKKYKKSIVLRLGFFDPVDWD